MVAVCCCKRVVFDMLHDLRTHSTLVFFPYSPRNIQITDTHPKYSTGYCQGFQ